MAYESGFVKNLIMFKKVKEIEEILHSGWDPNAGGGWPIRLAARYGCCSIVETLIRYGANPHLLSDSGASTLQLAVYSGEHWTGDRWLFLLSCCDSSQLADAAAVAIIFNNSAALQKIFETGRCNTHIPTTLTVIFNNSKRTVLAYGGSRIYARPSIYQSSPGKTLEQLAKGYKMTHLLNTSIRTPSSGGHTISHSPGSARAYRSNTRNTLTSPRPQQGNLSPSVARFFQETASQSSLISPRRSRMAPLDNSPTAPYLN